MTAISCRHVRPALGDLLPERCTLTWGHEGWHRAHSLPMGTGASWPSDEVGQKPPPWEPFSLDVA